MIHPITKVPINLGFNVILVMKLTAILITVALLEVSASVYSQSTKINLRIEQQSFRHILKGIRKQSDFNFLYESKVIQHLPKMSIDVSDQTLEEILDQLIVDHRLEYEINDRTVVIRKATYSLVPKDDLEAANIVTGTVKDDSNGDHLPGVNILIKGTVVGTITESDGTYSIEVPEDAVLLFSYVGYQTVEVVVGARSVIDVGLIIDISQMEDLVVIGYGVKKKVNLTGAVAIIDDSEIAGIPATNPAAMLQGRIAGVTITQNNGLPGSEETSILIRGLGTMNNSAPMVIVDGIEASMDNIAPDDIQSISVLKDAASSAIYGTRAANGVILVTTKRGIIGAPKITYSSYFGYQRPTNIQEHLPSADYARLINEGRINEGLSPQYTDSDIQNFEADNDPINYPNNDWLDLIMQGSGFIQNHNLSFSGGSSDTRYRTSFEYFDQKGLVKKTEKTRYNLRLNLDHKIKENFVIGTNLGLTRLDIEYPIGFFAGGNIDQLFRQANIMPPTFVNQFEDGSWGRWTDGNPVAFVENEPVGKAFQQRSEMYLNIFGELELFDGFKIKGVAALNYIIDDNKRHRTDIFYGDGSYQGPKSVEDELIRFSNFNVQGLITYEKNLGEHDIKALIASQLQTETTKYNSIYRDFFPSNLLDQIDAGSTINERARGYITETKLGSFFGRINYSYKGKYLIEANLRRDASSKFAKDNRVGWFPSVAGAWRISDEGFLSGISQISDIKLRVSWGQLGNHRIDDYQYIQSIALGQDYSFGDALAVGAAAIASSNPDITWETTTETNIGLDVSLFQKSTLTLGVDLYNRFTDNILTAIPVSQTFGLPAPIVNAGAMRNKGIELMLTHRNQIGEFDYDINLNFAYNDNKVESFPNPDRGEMTIKAEGISWDSFYGYEVVGIFQSNEEVLAAAIPLGSPTAAGDLKFRDQNDDGKIDGEDRIVLGNSIPNITFGLNLGAKYKGFDFVVFLQGADKVFRTLGNEAMWHFRQNSGNPVKMHLDRTIVENGEVIQKGNFPRTLISQQHNQVMSSFMVLDAAYLRLRNLQLGYSLPSNLLDPIKLSAARVYINGQNLLTLTKFPDGYDPEVANDRGNYYPQVKVYTVGINITF